MIVQRKILKNWNLKMKIFITTSMLLIIGVTAASAEEKISEYIDVSGQLTLQHIFSDNRDLGTGDSVPAHSISAQPRILTTITPAENTKIFADVQALIIDADTGVGAEDDTGRVSDFNKNFIELRQLWVRQQELLGITPLSAQIGRQRIRENRTIWWNRNFDAARITYNTTVFKGFIGAGQNFTSYRTNVDTDFRADDEDRFRIFAEGSWQHALGHYFDLRGLYEKDYSSLEKVGTTISANARDEEDLNAIWAGARFSGQFDEPTENLRFIEYQADLIGLMGTVDTLTTTGTANPNRRQIASNDERDLNAVAFDSTINIAPDIKSKPVITLGYAYGSGDDGDGSDTGFRQTDLQGNSSRMGLSSGSVRNYGEVLRPELSNLHITTAGVGFPITDVSDISAFHHYYHLDKEATSLRTGSIAAALDGEEKSVGHGVDLIYNHNLSKEFGWDHSLLSDVRLKLNVSGFNAGKAYGEGEDETSIRTFSELQIRF